MKPRTLLILLAAVLGLGAFIWFYERELPSSEERVKLDKQVLKVEKDDVTAITVKGSWGRIRLERTGTPPPKKDAEDEEVAARRTSSGRSWSPSRPGRTPSRWTSC